MSVHSYTWRGVDDPSRIDCASVEFAASGMRAFGTAIASDFATVWRLDVDQHWTTRGLAVTAHGFGWSRSLRLAWDDRGRWSTEVESAGDSELADPGLADPTGVDGALDCDLGLCPVTNTMPIRLQP